jgi:hypothetical protein
MKYTNHNWSVESLYTDSIATPKTISIPDLNYPTDFKKSSDEPSEAVITNITGKDISPMENIRFGSTVVNNIYSGTKTDVSSMAPNKQGVQILVELSETFRATNTVTGTEIDLPCKGRVVLKFPTHSCVTEAMVQELLLRTIAASFAKGSNTSSRVVEIARGSLLPNGL